MTCSTTPFANPASLILSSDTLFGLLADGDNQRLLGEDGGKLNSGIQVDATYIAKHYPCSCHNANYTIVIILWTLLGQNVLHIPFRLCGDTITFFYQARFTE
jgi:hypothetical protein